MNRCIIIELLLEISNDCGRAPRSFPDARESACVAAQMAAERQLRAARGARGTGDASAGGASARKQRRGPGPAQELPCVGRGLPLGRVLARATDCALSNSFDFKLDSS